MTVETSDPAQAIETATAAQRAGKFAEAERIYESIVSAHPDHFDALHLLGVARAQQGRLEEARRLIGRALLADPNFAPAHFHMGIVLQSLNLLEEALASYERALALRPDYAEASYNIGNVLREMGRTEDALRSYRRALAIKPDYAAPLCNLGVILEELKRPDEALRCYDGALAAEPGNLLALVNRGNVLREMGRTEDAMRSYRRALAIKPDCAAALRNLGVILQERKRRDEALRCYDAALAAEPGDLQALVNRGNVLIELNRFEDAVAALDAALAVRPDHAQAFISRGLALANLLRIDEALASYETALSAEPDLAQAQLNASLCRLLLGDYARGWREYESRWSATGLAKRDLAQPLWLGTEDIQGKTLLLHSEQGLGDTIQFCRYAELVAAKGARVIMEVQPPLQRLLATLAGADVVLRKGEELPDFDFHTPLLSLPLALGTSVSTIPSRVPYLAASESKSADWRKRLRRFPGTKVGLVWAGESRRQNPQSELVDKRRSTELRLFAPLARVPGIVFVSLQKGAPAAQARTPPKGMTLLDWTAELQDFADTAALVAALDLVIGVDTSVIHLAGALARPVWVLNRFDTCWRWFRDREDSPWYPTLRLFRQARPGDWTSVFDRVAQALAEFTRG